MYFIIKTYCTMKRSDFKLEPELKGMKVADIKKHVRAFNKHYAIQGYSKLKKAELVSAVVSAQKRLLQSKKTKKKVKLVVVEEPAKKATPAPAKKAAPLSFMEGVRARAAALGAERAKRFAAFIKRGDFTKAFKDEIVEVKQRLTMTRPEERKAGLPILSDEEKQAMRDTLAKNVKYDGKPLFKVGDKVQIRLKGTRYRRKGTAAGDKMIGTLTAFDKDAFKVTYKDDAGKEKKLRIDPDRDIFDDGYLGTMININAPDEKEFSGEEYIVYRFKTQHASLWQTSQIKSTSPIQPV